MKRLLILSSVIMLTSVSVGCNYCRPWTPRLWRGAPCNTCGSVPYSGGELLPTPTYHSEAMVEEPQP